MGFTDFLKGFSEEEKLYISNLIENFTEDEQEMFIAKYNPRRKNGLSYILLALLGFVGLAGFHRFYTNNILLGIAELGTFGFFIVGTLVDIINFRKHVTTANIEIAENIAFEVKEYFFRLSKANDGEIPPPKTMNNLIS